MAALAGGWFIPLTVSLGNFILNKIAPGDWLPKGPPPTPDRTMVRLWAGMTAEKGTDLEGRAPSIVLYDELGKKWGSWYERKKKLGMGDFLDYSIKGEKGNHRPSYIRIDAFNNDAICIAAVEVTYPDGGKAIIYPDVAFHLCGYAGYPSITDFPLPGVSSSAYHPYCIWLDANDDYGAFHPKSIHFHIPDFHAHNATVDAYNKNRDLLCTSSPRMGRNQMEVPDSIPFFDPPLIYDTNEVDVNGELKNTTFLDPARVLDTLNAAWPMTEKNGSPLVEPTWDEKTRKMTPCYRRKAKKRGLPTKRQATQDPRWVAFTSDMPTLSAEVVCGRPNALGPHFANLAEGKFCNMNDRTVWDICAGNNTTNCFDVATETLFGPATDNIIYPTVSNSTSETMGVSKLLQVTNRIDMLGS